MMIASPVKLRQTHQIHPREALCSHPGCFPVGLVAGNDDNGWVGLRKLPEKHDFNIFAYSLHLFILWNMHNHNSIRLHWFGCREKHPQGSGAWPPKSTPRGKVGCRYWLWNVEWATTFFPRPTVTVPTSTSRHKQLCVNFSQEKVDQI